MAETRSRLCQSCLDALDRAPMRQEDKEGIRAAANGLTEMLAMFGIEDDSVGCCPNCGEPLED